MFNSNHKKKQRKASYYREAYLMKLKLIRPRVNTSHVAIYVLTAVDFEQWTAVPIIREGWDRDLLPRPELRELPQGGRRKVDTLASRSSPWPLLVLWWIRRLT